MFINKLHLISSIVLKYFVSNCTIWLSTNNIMLESSIMSACIYKFLRLSFIIKLTFYECLLKICGSLGTCNICCLKGSFVLYSTFIITSVN